MLNLKDKGPIIPVIVSILIFVSFFGLNRGLWWDEAVYLSLAGSIHDGGGYFINTGEEAFRPPLLPAIAAGVWGITGPSPAAVMWLPVLFGILAVGMTYALARRLFSGRVAFWSSLMLGTSFNFLFFGERFLTETLFIFLGTLSVYLFWEGLWGRKHMFPAAGAAMALAFLTRYAGILLMGLFLLYAVKDRKLRKREYWYGPAVFAIMLLPWLAASISSYGSAIGTLIEASMMVDAEFYNYPAYFYLLRWFNIFGLVGAFAVPGFYLMLKRHGKGDLPVGFLIGASLLFFMFLVQRKEERYLMHFFSFFYIAMGIGVDWLMKRTGRRRLVAMVAAVLIIANVVTAAVVMSDTRLSSYALTRAGEYLSGKEGAILSNSYPVLHYLSGMKVYDLPDSPDDLDDLIREKGITFIVIDRYEPTYPEWSRTEDGTPSPAMHRFALEKEFWESGRNVVWIFRTDEQLHFYS